METSIYMYKKMEGNLFKSRNQFTNKVETDNSTTSKTLVTNSTFASEMLAPTEVAAVEDVDSMKFLLVPLAVLFAIFILSALVYLMARNRRRLAQIYCKHKNVPHFKFDSDSDSALEQGDPTECLLKGKLQIDNSYESHRTTDVNKKLVRSHSEIYT